MGKKGGGEVKNYQRPLSPQELRLLETQNQMRRSGIAVSNDQEKRSMDQYRQWQQTYQPIETGLFKPGATRATGYYTPEDLQGDPPQQQAPQQYQQQGYGGSPGYTPQSSAGNRPKGGMSNEAYWYMKMGGV